MGLAEWGARKIKKKGKKGDNNESEGRSNTADRETSGARQLPKPGSPYRDVPLSTADLTRDDLERVLNGLLQRRPGLEEDIKDLVGSVRDDTRRRARMTLEEQLTEKGHLLTEEQEVKLHETVKTRFEEHNKDKKFRKARKGIEWGKVWAKLKANPQKIWSLNEMERTGGEPDVVGIDEKTGEYIFMDCSEESPVNRRNVCFNRVGQERAEKIGGKPAGNAVDMAKDMGVKILRKREYLELQKLGNFDGLTFSWLVPDDMSEEEMETAGVALSGVRTGGGVRVAVVATAFHDGNSAFRCSLRV